MKIHTVFITHNRLELTKRAIESYLDTVSVPYTFKVIDNGSTDGTVEWLHENHRYSYYAFGENLYPGFATNFGWNRVWRGCFADTTHLHRADNDFGFLPGWCEEVERRFRNKHLGQLGLRTNEEELFEPYNVGGNCVVRRELWDQGLRWDERSWPQIRDEVGKGHTEDSLFSVAVKQMGYKWGRVKKPCIVPLANPDMDDEYYKRSFGDRGIYPE